MIQITKKRINYVDIFASYIFILIQSR